MRYYKSAQDTGTHTGSLWTSTGTLLATATFTNESASGWQTVTFAQPITVSAGTTYVASYHSNGFYAATPNYFATNHTNGPLTAPASSGTAAETASIAYGSGSLFPTATYSATNYWVDVLYRAGRRQHRVRWRATTPGFFDAVQHAALASGEHACSPMITTPTTIRWPLPVSAMP